jgi:hypothetical protein
LPREIRVYAFSAGWGGVAIYFLMDVLAERRRRKAQRVAANKLSNRVDRHVPRRPRPRWGVFHKPVATNHQYLPVARSDRLSIRF